MNGPRFLFTETSGALRQGYRFHPYIFVFSEVYPFLYMLPSAKHICSSYRYGVCFLYLKPILDEKPTQYLYTHKNLFLYVRRESLTARLACAEIRPRARNTSACGCFNIWGAGRKGQAGFRPRLRVRPFPGSGEGSGDGGKEGEREKEQESRGGREIVPSAT
jgi:hypothetical protein